MPVRFRSIRSLVAFVALAIAMPACSSSGAPPSVTTDAPSTQIAATTTTTTTTTTPPPATTTTLPPPDDFDLASAAVLHHGDLPDELSSFMPVYAEVVENYTWLFEHEEWEVFAEAFAPAVATDATDIEWADTAILVLPTADAALERLREGVDAARVDDFWGLQREFTVADVGAEAAGLVFYFSYEDTEDHEGEEWYETQVAFASGRFLGMATITHGQPVDHTALAGELASRLEARLEGVLAGAIDTAERSDDYFALAWTPNRRLDAFTVSFTMQFDGDFPAAPMALHGSGAALGPDVAECTLTASQFGFGSDRVVLHDGAYYYDTGSGYEAMELGDMMYDTVYFCPVFAEFWEESGLDEDSLRWELGLESDPLVVELAGRPARHYDLSDHPESVDFMFTQGLGEIRTFEIWYPIDDVWPLRVNLEASGDLSAMLGPGFATGGDLGFQVLFEFEITPEDPADVTIETPDVIRSGDPSA